MRHLLPSLLFFLMLSCGEVTPDKSKNEEPTQNPTLPVKESVDNALAGSWELAGLPQSPLPFSKLYPRQRPIVFIQADVRLISGSTGCNRFSATISTVGNQLNFTNFSSSTLTCGSEAESNFLSAWKNAEKYSFRNPDELVWGTDSVAWMVFRRK